MLMLVNYQPFWSDIPSISGGIDHPLYRRKFLPLCPLHTGSGESIDVAPQEVLSVVQHHPTAPICVELVPDRDGFRRVAYLNADEPWVVECYSPHGELVGKFTAKDLVWQNHES